MCEGIKYDFFSLLECKTYSWLGETKDKEWLHHSRKQCVVGNSNRNCGGINVKSMSAAIKVGLITREWLKSQNLKHQILMTANRFRETWRCVCWVRRQSLSCHQLVCSAFANLVQLKYRVRLKHLCNSKKMDWCYLHTGREGLSLT